MSYSEDKKARIGGIIATAAVLVVIFALVSGVCFYLASETAGKAAVQQENLTGPMMSSSSKRNDGGPLTVTTPQTEVPNLSSLIGTTYNQAVADIGHGATPLEGVSGDFPEREGMRRVTLALTSERSDPQTGAPTVYLDVDAGDRVMAAGYSVSLESLGYNGDPTLRQAVERLHVAERTLGQAGVAVEEGTARVPADRSTYSTYRGDGTTLEREFVSFEGDSELNGLPVTWYAAIDYNYADAVKSGNLADAMHLITVGIALPE